MPLIDFPYEVLEKVVELFYYGEIRVLNSLKGKVYKALKFLDVDIPEPPKPPPRPKKTPLDLSIDDDVPVNGGTKSVSAFVFNTFMLMNAFYS